MNATRDPGRRRLLDFGSIGWVVLIAVIMMALFAWRVIGPALKYRQQAPAAAGGAAAAYNGFSLTPCLVDSAHIVASVPRDRIPALSDPSVLAGADVAAFNTEQRRRYHRKFLVPGDRVIGLQLGGQARAYPLNVLNWHEAVNDTLGGQAVLVSYNPLCDSAVAMSRRVGENEYQFGVSGLLYNSNLLLYDRQAELSQSSLWCQLQWRAVAGPAARNGLALEVLPLQLTTWERWLAEHPETTVISGDMRRLDSYNGSPYSSYFATGQLRFPATPAPPAGGPEPFARVLVLLEPGGWRVLPYSEIESQLDGTGVWRDGALSLYFLPVSPQQEQPCAWAAWDGTEQYASISCLWFAWYALHPDVMPVQY